jgi:phage repressor protein C with HTH and peptisase S24 domain
MAALSLGQRLRKQRRRLGLTLDELAARTSISKPYLSLIETERTPNPPADDKLRRLEHALNFPPGELVTLAHLARTPADVRRMLHRLIADRGMGTVEREDFLRAGAAAEAAAIAGDSAAGGNETGSVTAGSDAAGDVGIDLDAAYLSGALQQMVDEAAGNIEQVPQNAIPIINKVSAGYPKDFTDLSYPAGVADSYVTCPDVRDAQAFAARVCGDSMMPKYREGDLVVFTPSLMARSGDDCFVRFEDGQTTFKRVFFESDENGKAVLRLQPRNEKYRPQTVSAEQVTGLYKAHLKFQRVDEGDF